MNNQYNNTWYHDENEILIPTYYAKKKSKRIERRIAWLLTATMIGSAVLGFGGGILATRVGQFSNTTIQQTKSGSSNINPIQIAAGDKSSFNAAAVAAVGMDSVVEITTESLSRGNSIMGQFISKGAGSGVIISNDGYIVTNNHVVKDANKITVRTRDSKEYQASVVGVDEKTDLAVVKIEGNNLKAAEFGKSYGLIVGQPVLAIGNPLGELGGTVTDGIISALDREVEIENQKMTLLQTNASVNPGNSGGGLFDGNGKLVGIVNAKSSGSGIEGLGFAIPIDTAHEVIDQLIKNGYVTGRIDIGMEFLDVNEQAAFLYRLPQEGVYISSVKRGSYADQVGLRSGDRVLAVADKKITNSDDISEALTKYKVGDKVKLQIERDGKQSSVDLTLGEEKPTSASLF